MNTIKRWLKKTVTYSAFAGMLAVVFALFSCMQQKPVKSPKGYDLSAPQKYSLPLSLTEISGIAFYKGDPKTIYAHEDETGKLYFFGFGDKDVSHVKFGGHGDYEDIALCRDQFIILRSDGVLFTFPYKEVASGSVDHVNTISAVLPEGEYESLSADERTGKLFVLCKNCKGEKKDKRTLGYVFNLISDGSVTPAGTFSIDTRQIEALSGKNKLKFEPSALAKDPLTGEWYILSSVNKLLVIADAGWKVKQVYALNPSVFPQPEGMAFDRQNNLYISNEGGLGSGTILKFIYKK